MVGSPGQAEVVILLCGVEVTPPTKELGLLVVGRAEVIEAVGVARLLVERPLKGIDRPEVVALLIKADSLA
jgi:hypothetical protein